ncbi:MAG: hypothetical protein AAGC95_09765 [Pseudomonadota bacterium]
MQRFAFIAALSALIVTSAALAQTSDDFPMQRLRAFLEERAATRPVLNPPPIGRAPLREDAAQIDWAQVDRLLAEAEKRDAAVRQKLSRGVAGASDRLSEGLRSLSADRLPNIAAPELDRVRMPVLVPSSIEVLNTVQVFGQPDAYTAIATAAPGVALRISGARKKLVLERPPRPSEALKKLREERPPLPGMGSKYVITRSESSTDLSFSRFGCGYVISITCDDPDRDARCTEDAFITSLASSMALLKASAVEEDAGEQQ